MRRRKTGFTLIELLIVMMIIGILIIILVPGLFIRSKTLVRTKKIMGALDAALQAYSQKFRAFPPSKMPSGYPNASGISTGAQCLYYFLLGPNGEGWDTTTQEGEVPAAYLWAPAADLDRSWMVSDMKETGNGGRATCAKYFCDGGPEKVRAILYYRADVMVQGDGTRPVKYDDVYDRSDNNDTARTFWTPPADEWKKLIVNKDSYNEAPYNPGRYLLVAPGEDRVFGYVDRTCDDILNVKRKD